MTLDCYPALSKMILIPCFSFSFSSCSQARILHFTNFVKKKICFLFLILVAVSLAVAFRFCSVFLRAICAFSLLFSKFRRKLWGSCASLEVFATGAGMRQRFTASSVHKWACEYGVLTSKCYPAVDSEPVIYKYFSGCGFENSYRLIQSIAQIYCYNSVFLEEPAIQRFIISDSGHRIQSNVCV